VGEVPTPYGAIAVKWGVSAHGAVTMNVAVPSGTTGTIAIPSGGTVTINGKAVPTSASSALDARASGSDGSKYGYIDNVQPGAYVIESANRS
jgi:alpha-L-rhamnosidase